MDVNRLNASIRGIGIPLRMTRRPLDDRGFPVPYFVAKINGQWDFRVIEPGRLESCYKNRLCWLCGEKLGQYLCFVIGPMCSVNRINSEPPSHLECAQYAVKACPFLTRPRMRRNEVDIPVNGIVAGDPIAHNPGAAAIWITKTYGVKRVQNGVLFTLGKPLNVLWYAEGRPATRGEVIEAMYKGLPELEKKCYTRPSKDALTAAVAEAMKWLPPEEIGHAGYVRHEEHDREGLRSGGEDPAKDGSAGPG